MVKSNLIASLSNNTATFENEFASGTVTLAKGNKTIILCWFGPNAISGVDSGKVTFAINGEVKSVQVVSNLSDLIAGMIEKKGFTLPTDLTQCSVCGSVIKSQYKNCILHKTANSKPKSKATSAEDFLDSIG